MKPSLLARTVYQVGSPAIFDGNMFLPDTGMPIWKIERRRTRLAVWLPDPLTVATWMLKSLTTLVISPLRAQQLLRRCTDIRWALDHPHAGGGERVHLLFRRAAAARDDRARVPHAASRRRGLPGDEADHRLLEVRLDPRRGVPLGVAAD